MSPDRFSLPGLAAVIALTLMLISGCGGSTLDIPPASKVTVVVVDAETVEERARVVVTEASMRSRFVAAINRLEFPGKGVPLSEAADMPAIEILLSIQDESGSTHGLGLFWGPTGGNSVVYGAEVFEVSSGLAEIRELVSEVADLENDPG